MANAYSQVWKSITGVPATDMSAKRYTFVNFNADGKVVTPAAGGAAVGVIYEPNNVDEPAQVVASGFAFIKLGGTVAAGDEVETNASGQAIKLATGKSLGIAAVGGAAGALGTVLLK